MICVSLLSRYGTCFSFFDSADTTLPRMVSDWLIAFASAMPTLSVTCVFDMRSLPARSQIVNFPSVVLLSMVFSTEIFTEKMRCDLCVRSKKKNVCVKCKVAHQKAQQSKQSIQLPRRSFVHARRTRLPPTQPPPEQVVEVAVRRCLLLDGVLHVHEPFLVLLDEERRPLAAAVVLVQQVAQLLVVHLHHVARHRGRPPRARLAHLEDLRTRARCDARLPVFAGE
eukprot:Rhum_TRINITY_DN8697_c1_g1::Rhum_TRINITY_DN8697_c1_g1_i1::g.28917::m.28917